MKKLLYAAILFVAMFATGQAQAFFEEDHLVQVFYTKDNNKVEIGLDLGRLGTDFNLTDQNKTLFTVDLATLAATKEAVVSELSMGMYIDSLINTSDPVWDHYFITTDKTIPDVPSATKYSLMNTAAGVVRSFYINTVMPDVVTQLNNGQLAVADPTWTNSYRTRMNQGNYAPGVYSNMNTNATPGELKLADMTGDYTDLYLWHFSYDGTPRTSHLVAGDNTDYVAVIRFYASGETVLNPTTSQTSTPDAPIMGSASAGQGQATVNFTPPTSDGGSAITTYTVTSTPGALSASGSTSPLTVTGLTNGTAYTFTVTATNAVGTGPASSASNSVTPQAEVPGSPIIGTALAGQSQATVRFTAPSTNGGSPITRYTVISSPGGKTASGTKSPITVKGLINGTAYTFTVKATNVVGTGPASAASNSVIPQATKPGAPTIGTATAGNGQAIVPFTPPTSNGGSPITRYTVTSSPGGKTANGLTSPIIIKGLTNGTAYTFTVKATNAIGTGLASAASNSVTPLAKPGAPTIGTASAGNGQATVRFTPPTSNGGSPITRYTVTSSPGGKTANGLTSPITVKGLTNGTAYTFTVRATNVIGTGLPSAASNSVTPRIP